MHTLSKNGVCSREWRVGRKVVNDPFVGITWRCSDGGREYLEWEIYEGPMLPGKIQRSRTGFVASSGRPSDQEIGHNIREYKCGGFQSML